MILLVERAHKRDERGGRGSHFSFFLLVPKKHQPLRLVGESFHGRKEVLLIAAAVCIFCQVLEPVSRKSPLRFTFKIDMIKDMY